MATFGIVGPREKKLISIESLKSAWLKKKLENIFLPRSSSVFQPSNREEMIHAAALTIFQDLSFALFMKFVHGIVQNGIVHHLNKHLET